ncbi:MAG: aminopeptidase [Sedimenticola sp.]|nr:aminopeptidase [Sedimenticola sp.]
MLNRGIAFRLGLTVAILLLQGCSTLAYYSQSVSGHLQLMGQSRPIERLLQDPATEPGLKQRLRQVVAMREFATRELALPENGSYRSYAALERKAVVWSVVATGTFSLQPRQWCYLFIGCASYRGYFSRDRAQAYADQLREAGLDVAVEAVPAYSTLGWFDDPLPSTVIEWPLPRIATLMFHELAHQQLYVKDDSAFNEAFASLVAEVGTRSWLATRDPAALPAWRRSLVRERQFVALLLAFRERLSGLYREPLPILEMARRKALLFDLLRTRYRALKAEWGGYSGFDGWFDRPLNNAHLASIATYESWVPAFRQLLEQSDNHLPSFYRASEALGSLPPDVRTQRMQALRRLALAAAVPGLPAGSNVAQ